MANPPTFQVQSAPAMSAEDARATASPARGAQMRNFLQERLQRNRAPPLVHSWDFWHDRQDRAPQGGHGSQTPDASGNYEDRLVKLTEINDVKSFWGVFNNFDISDLPLRDSVHLFHKGIKPVWEDPRNERGGSWTFRVPKNQAPDFWKEVCMMAIGEQLQAAVESERTTFRDDICGISLGVRFNSLLVQVWNRDGNHEDGTQRMLQVILANLSPELRPRDGSYYYKKHSEHTAFTGSSSSTTPGQNSTLVPDLKSGASVGKSTPPNLSTKPSFRSEADRNAAPIAEMDGALQDMKRATDVVANGGPMQE